MPEECRIGTAHLSHSLWKQFLSACVLYDPPDDHLEQYANHHHSGQMVQRDFEGEPFIWPLSSLYHVRPAHSVDEGARAAEDAWSKLFNRFVNNIIERQKMAPHSQKKAPHNIDLVGLLRQVMKSPDFFSPKRAYVDENPTRRFIEVKPWHTEEDIRDAFRMISGAQEERPR